MQRKFFKNIRYINTPQALQQFVVEIQDCTWLAIDTEFMRERTYYSRLCLIQIAAKDQLVCIDPLAIKNLKPLFNLLFDSNITKVFHAPQQDLEIFYYLMHKVPAPIFDTQLASALLGMGNHISYVKLIQQLLNIHLEKSQSRSNWSHRPLTPAQIKYAIEDVQYLQQAYPILCEKLQQKKRLAWLNADFKQLSASQNYKINNHECWKKVKGVQILRPQQLAVLRELAQWRETFAQEKNLPKRWIISDEILIRLARQQPQNKTQLKKIYGISNKQITKYYTIWHHCIKKGQAIPTAQLPQKRQPKNLTKAQKLMLDQLMMAVRHQANRYSISPTIITTRKQLEKMLRNGKTRLAEDWRGNLVNQLFTDILNGKTGFQTSF